MKCHVCGKTIGLGPLFRQNPKGEVPAVWACSEHDKVHQKDIVLREICGIIHEGNKKE